MEAKFNLNLYFFHFEFDITRIVGALRGLLPLNIFLLPAMIATYAAAGYIVWNHLSANAEHEVMETARLMLAGAQAMRTYTTTQVAPLLDQEQAKVEHGVQNMKQVLDVQIPEVLQKAMTGLPTAREQRILQSSLHEILRHRAPGARAICRSGNSFRSSIPCHAATKESHYFKEQYPHFDYAEAALDPTNPQDRTTDWQKDIVKNFRENPSKTEVSFYRDTPVGSSFTLSRPIRADSSCLACHGRAENAPPELVKKYGSDNGFNWPLDVIGVQVVSVPAELAHNRAVAAIKTVSIWLGGIFAGLYAIVNVIAFAFISRLAAKPAAP